MSRQDGRVDTGQAGRGRAVRAVLAVLCVGGLLGAAGWAVRDMEMPITVVRIDGSMAHTPAESVEKVVTRHTSRGGFFRIDLAALKGDLEALPWLRSASLRRVWPDTLDVVVREHRAVARWNDDALISERGVVFRPVSVTLDRNVPSLSGPSGHGPDMLQRLGVLERRLAALHLGVRGLHQDARRSWRIELDNAVVLRLGRGNIQPRLDRFVAVWPAVLARRADRIEAVDLRYPNGFAVAWQQGDGTAAREGGA